jgi:DNA replicative helicase MCM subunit Mcm2 (Cdc46/Mcm family)
VVGHITAEELRRYLDSTEVANGFANRFLWLCVSRSKCLPEGGHLQEQDFGPLIRGLQKALDFARQTQRVRFDDEAREIWHRIYPELSEGQPGLFGAVTARAEAQVVRLALIYALLDCSEFIRQPHLMAGLALWEYCQESAACIFGDSLGDPDADEILAALRRNFETGLTRTQISALFGRNRTSGQIDRALRLLLRKGKVRCEQNRETGGKPAEVWFATRRSG